MKRTTLKDRLADSNRPAIILIVVVLAIYHGYAVGAYFARVPSASMSREIEVARSALPQSGLRGTHVLSAPTRDNDSVLILFSDGLSARLVEVDPLGEVISSVQVNLDLSEFSQTAAAIDRQGTLVVHALDDRLRTIEIDTTTGAVRETAARDGVESFRRTGSALILETSDGLAFVGVDSDSEPISLVNGDLLSYAVDSSVDEIDPNGDGTWVAAVLSRPGRRFDVVIAGVSGTGRVSRTSVFENSPEDQYRKLEAIQARSGVIDLLFLFRDNRFNRNNLSVRRYGLPGIELLHEFEASAPILNTEFTFVGATEESSVVLMRRRTNFGYNLAAATMSDARATFAEFTKTRSLSTQSAFLELTDSSALVFFDVNGEEIRVYFASDDPEIARRSTRPTLAIAARALAVTLTISVMALFLGAVYLFFSAIPPFLVVTGIQRFFRRFRRKNLILCLIGSLVYTGGKLSVTYFVIDRTFNYVFGAPWIGEPPAIYWAVSATSVISFLLVLRFLKPEDDQKNSASGTLLRFVLVDSAHYTMIFIAYIVTSLLITKI